MCSCNLCKEMCKASVAMSVNPKFNNLKVSIVGPDELIGYPDITACPPIPEGEGKPVPKEVLESLMESERPFVSYFFNTEDIVEM